MTVNELIDALIQAPDNLEVHVFQVRDGSSPPLAGVLSIDHKTGDNWICLVAKDIRDVCDMDKVTPKKVLTFYGNTGEVLS